MTLGDVFFRSFQFIYLLTVIGVVLIVISENRNPVKTISWIVVLLFLPFFGLIVYAFFGQNYTRKRIISKRLYYKLKQRPLDVADSEPTQLKLLEYESLVCLLGNLNQSPILSGNDVKFFINGKDKFESFFQDIAEAQNHIHIEYYAFEDDDIGNKLKDLLISKSSQGVIVRVIYDAVGSWKTKNSFFEEMKSAGISVYPFLKVAFPLFTSKVNYRNHRKIVVIDGTVGYMGGMNVADRYVSGFKWGAWRDTQIRIKGKAVQGLQSIFLIDWAYVSKETITSFNYFPKLESYGENQMQIVSSGPMSAYGEICQGMLQAFYNAKKCIYIQTPYFIPPEAMGQALLSASLRGVDVRLLLPSRSDSRLVNYASLSYIKNLLKENVKVYFYKKGFLHSKLMLVDDSLTLIGSANFDVRSFEQNFEVEAFIYDEETTAKAKSIFLDDLNHSEMVTLARWKKRPLVNRIRESFCRLFTPLI